MSNGLLSDFIVDKASKTVIVHREFDAELSLVWDAFTVKDILDQWWAPLPYRSETKVMDFKVGGRRFYAMVSPDGQKRWALQKYTSIHPRTNFKMYNSFADENENPELTGSEWDFNFVEKGEKTLVKITITNESLERFEKMLAYGFKEGFTASLQQIDSLLTRKNN